MTMRKIIDLSIYLENDVISDPEPYRPKIDYISHKDTLDDLVHFFPGMKPSDMPDEEAWAIERVNLITHNGTHLDAPYHYATTMDKGERAITIDEVPLDWCFRPAIKLDFRDKPNGYVVQVKDVENELERINHQLSPFDIVLMNTAAGGRYGHDDYVSSGCGFGREATLYLLEKGVRLTGTDAWSWDAPFDATAEKFTNTKDPNLIWEGHKAGLEIGYCHLEKLHNLESLPDKGYYVSCFPFKIRGASAGWTRAVAIFDDNLIAGVQNELQAQ